MTYPTPDQQFYGQQPPAQPYPPMPNQPYPPQGYQQPVAQPGYPQLPPQAYQQPQGQQQPSQPLAQGTLDGYFSQPSSGGGAALKFENPGQTQVGIVARPVTNADVQQQTQPGSGQPAFYKDGRPKFVMKVPLRVQPDQTHPDGLAQWYVAGGARDELVRAMAAAGAPEGPPEAGAAIRITFTGTRPSGAGMNPAKVFQVEYARPDGAAPAPAAQPAPQPAAQPQVEVPQQQAQPAPAEQPAAPAPAPATGDGEGLSPEQQKLLASLTGQQG